jgi:hypothetical protein
MKTNQTTVKRKARLSASTIKTIGYTALLTLSLTIGMHYAQAKPLQSGNVYGYKQNQNQYDRIDAALAPIALYPDSLLTHIFIASTYPLEVIEAARFIQQHPSFDIDDYQENGLSKAAIESIQEDALDYGWDASVVALTAFPDILNNMSDDLGWLSDLGEAFENDQELVLQRVQALRELAYDQGNLQNDDQVEVVVEQAQNQRVIVIEPRRQEVVYVPYYDTTVVYGPSWHVSASYRWTRPYYARHYRHRHVYFSPAAYIGHRLLFGGIHWSNRHVSINRDWSYRGARHYRYVDTRYKRVKHKSYQRWSPVKRATRHIERKKYAGTKKAHRVHDKNKWVTSKHREFKQVRANNREFGTKRSKGEVKQKLYRNKETKRQYQTKPMTVDKQLRANNRNFKQEKQVSVNRNTKSAIKRTQVEKKTVVQRSTIKRSTQKQVQRSRDVSKPKRSQNRPQTNKRSHNKAQKVK